MTGNRDTQIAEVLGDYRRWLYKVAGDMLGTGSQEVDDLVQEGYIAMWRALGTYDEARGGLAIWLTNAARWRMGDVMRRQHWTGTPTAGAHHRERPGIPVEARHLDRMVVAGELEMAYHRGEIARALASLTPGQREAIYRKFWLDEIVHHGFWKGAVPKLAEALAHLAECCE